MRSPLLRLALVAALLAGLDAHLALLQGYAWGSMAWRAARSGTVTSALTEAFDGRHPCAVCLVVKRAAPVPTLSAAAPAKADLFHQPALTLPRQWSSVAWAPPFALHGPGPSLSLLVPPPKTVLA